MMSENSEFQNADGLVVCPCSLDHWSPLSDYKLHHVHPDELRANGGICAACRTKAAKANGHFKTKEEMPATSADLVHFYPGLEDHAGFDSGEKIQTVDFDVEALDQATEAVLSDIEQLTPEDRLQTADVLARIMVFVWENPASIRTAYARWAILCRGLRPDLVGMNFRQIAKALGITKQAVSKMTTKAERVWGMHFISCRKQSARNSMREARLKNPVSRKMNGSKQDRNRQKQFRRVALPTPGPTPPPAT